VSEDCRNRALIAMLSRRPTPDLVLRLCGLAVDIARVGEGSGPTAEELAQAPLLENWTVALALSGPVLTGDVVNHPQLGSRKIATSPVWLLDPDSLAWARTLSRFYRLGAPARARPANNRSDLH